LPLAETVRSRVIKALERSGVLKQSGQAVY